MDDPNASMRHPLTVLICLLPLSILGELYRWILLKEHALLADEVWHELGQATGLVAPLIPSLLLLAGCMSVMLLERLRWDLPELGVLLRILLWSLLWCLVRTVISFTNTGLHVDSVEGLGTIGLCMSGAIQEELIFRAGLIGVIAWTLSALSLNRNWLQWLLWIPAALLFALAHTHVMNSSLTPEQWQTALFVEHCAAGLIYGYVFIRQGLVVATLSHFFFNMLVVSGILSGI